MFQDISMIFDISGMDYNETDFDDLIHAIDVAHNKTMYGKTDIEVRYTMHLT